MVPEKWQVWPARITDADDSSGEWRYAWIEQTTEADDGAYADHPTGRYGTTDSSYATEANGTLVPTDTIVWLREKCYLGGNPVYEFVHCCNGGASYSVATATAITSNQNNYSLPTTSGGATPSIVYLPVNAASTITGIVKTVTNQKVTLVNTGTSVLTIAQQSSSSTAANRIITATGGSATSGGIDVPPGQTVEMVYDEVEARWRIITGTATSYDQTAASATISTDQDDYTITAPAPVQFWSVTSASTITGIVPPVGLAEFTIVNTGTALLTLAHQSASSTAANRIITYPSADIVVPPGSAVRLVRDRGSARWRVPDGSAASQPGAVYLPERSAPATPSSGSVALYAKSDGRAYLKDDTGAEIALSAPSTPPSTVALTATPTWFLAKAITHSDLTAAAHTQDVAVYTLPAKACLLAWLVRTKTAGNTATSLAISVYRDGSPLSASTTDGLSANNIGDQGLTSELTDPVLSWTATKAIDAHFSADVDVNTITVGEWEVYLLLATMG